MKNKPWLSKEEYNDLFYVCSLVEYIARVTKNRRGVIVQAWGMDGIRKQLKDASVNHCLSFEQVGTELIEQYNIPNGDFDPAANSPYLIPSYTDIGNLYATMIEDSSETYDMAREIMDIFSSFISDLISNFKSDLYYQNPDFLECSYKAGYLLE